MIRPLFIAVLATILMTVWLTAQNRGGVNLLAPCGPEIVKNGSFEASNYTATGFLFLSDANNCVKKDDPCLDAWNVGLLAKQIGLGSDSSRSDGCAAGSCKQRDR